jgi:hypothetical protein
VTSAYIHTDRYKKKDVAGSDYRKVEILTMRSTRRFRPQDDAMASSAVGKAVFARVGVERNKKQLWLRFGESANPILEVGFIRGGIAERIHIALVLSAGLVKRPCAQRSALNTYHGDALPSELRGR